MVYCSKCGKKNDDAAEFCNQCGQRLAPSQKQIEKDWEEHCERECSGKEDSSVWRFFWGLVVLCIGIWIIFELVLKNLADEIAELAWIKSISFPFWWVIGAAFGIIVIAAGIRILIRK